MRPKVSICIPTYNSARYLPAAIESVLSQDFDDYELLICDNVSTDETEVICRSYTDLRIRYIRFERLVNQGGNWNRCLRLARGEYVALLHSDDAYLPGFISERVRMLDEHAEVGLAFGAVRLIDEEGAEMRSQSFSESRFIAAAPEFLAKLLFGCVINPVSPMVRRSCYEAVGEFNEERLWGIDWEMWLRLAARYGVAYSPIVTAAYRVHSASGTSTGLLQPGIWAEDLEVMQKIFRDVDERPELAALSSLRRKAYRKLALRSLYAAAHNCEKGNVQGVKQTLRFVIQTDWSLLSRPTVWALWLSCVFGPRVYRVFRQLRPVRR